jgi:hypothetical protein
MRMTLARAGFKRLIADVAGAPGSAAHFHFADAVDRDLVADDGCGADQTVDRLRSICFGKAEQFSPEESQGDEREDRK